MASWLGTWQYRMQFHMYTCHQLRSQPLIYSACTLYLFSAHIICLHGNSYHCIPNMCRQYINRRRCCRTGAGTEAFCSGGDQSVRGKGGYVGADGVPRLNVLDLQVDFLTHMHASLVASLPVQVQIKLSLLPVFGLALSLYSSYNMDHYCQVLHSSDCCASQAAHAGFVMLTPAMYSMLVCLRAILHHELLGDMVLYQPDLQLTFVLSTPLQTPNNGLPLRHSLRCRCPRRAPAIVAPPLTAAGMTGLGSLLNQCWHVCRSK